MHVCHLTYMAHQPVYCFPMKRLEHRTSKLDKFLGGRRDLENYLKEGRCNRRVFVPPPFLHKWQASPRPRVNTGLLTNESCLTTRHFRPRGFLDYNLQTNTSNIRDVKINHRSYDSVTQVFGYLSVSQAR